MRPTDARRFHDQVGVVHYQNGTPMQVRGRIQVAGDFLSVHDPKPGGCRRGEPIPISQIQQIDIDGQPAQLTFD